MTSKPPEPSPPQLRVIRRKQVQQSLLVSAFIASQLITGCSDIEPDDVDPPEIKPEPVVSALFYETTEQCETNAQKQADDYALRLNAHQAKQLDAASNIGQPNTPPKQPEIQVSDCAAQMTAGQQEHDRHAPVYASMTDCQADGVQCEPTPAGYDNGYRPSYGGTYLYSTDYRSPNYNNHTWSSIYIPRTVYRGLNPGQIVTANGQILAKTGTGRVTVPEESYLAGPPRPTGYAAQGTIMGRSNNGFGSTYKETGRGGK
jgi:hypothetical protein